MDGSQQLSRDLVFSALARNPDLLSGLHDVIRGRAEIRRLALADIEVWKTVPLGSCSNADEYLRSLDAAKCAVENSARNAMLHNEFPWSREPRYLDLAVVTPAELGFKNLERRERIFGCAVGRGLELCPPEVGPAARLIHLQQPPKDPLVIAMSEFPYHNPILFSLECGSQGLKLGAEVGDAGLRWKPDTKFVFVRPPKKKPH